MRGPLTYWLILGLLLGTAIYAIAEDLTLTTYYPSPRGVYQELKTAGDMVVGDITNPPAARLHVVGSGAAPALRIDDALNDTSPVLVDAAGNVGIGTASPSSRLTVNGDLTTTGNVAGSDILAGGQSVVTILACSGDITCTKAGNAYTISVTAPAPGPGPAPAPGPAPEPEPPTIYITENQTHCESLGEFGGGQNCYYTNSGCPPSHPTNMGCVNYPSCICYQEAAPCAPALSRICLK